jgi:hypothetical protein
MGRSTGFETDPIEGGAKSDQLGSIQQAKPHSGLRSIKSGECRPQSISEAWVIQHFFSLSFLRRDFARY